MSLCFPPLVFRPTRPQRLFHRQPRAHFPPCSVCGALRLCCPPSLLLPTPGRVLGLSDVADTIVGDSMTRGISGGQRKRVRPLGGRGVRGRHEHTCCHGRSCCTWRLPLCLCSGWPASPCPRSAWPLPCRPTPHPPANPTPRPHCPVCHPGAAQVTTGEILSGPQSVLLMDEISTGLDRWAPGSRPGGSCLLAQALPGRTTTPAAAAPRCAGLEANAPARGEGWLASLH